MEDEYKLTAHDYHVRHYETTVGWRTSSGRIQPIFVTGERCGYDEDGDEDEPSSEYEGPSLVGEKMLANGQTRHIEVEVDNPNLILKMPQLGWFNTQRTAIFTSRRHEKYWRTTYCPSTVSTFNPYRDLLRSKGLGVSIGSGRFLIDLFNQKFFSFEEAFNRVASGQRVGAAITPQLMLGLVEGRKGIRRIGLYNRELLVGLVQQDRETTRLFKHTSDFFEELSELGVRVARGETV